MKFVSTRGSVAPVEIRAALEAGLAPDGGLFIPEVFPQLEPSDFNGLNTLAQVAEKLLRPFFKDDALLSTKLSSICAQTFSFPIPLTETPNHHYLLELFHGPTSAFKDVGANFLANTLSNLPADHPRKIIVATSGDTGGAVAGAFFKKPNLEVVILFPKGKISPRQQAQLCAWGENIRAYAVEGTFDDCQKIAKQALLEQSTQTAGAPSHHWRSANSINLGRILPQMVYYAFAALTLWRKDQAENPTQRRILPGFIIPSGNLGNSLAALWAKKMGLPIGKIHLSLNANATVANYRTTGELKPSPTVATLANAMDVGNPSNLERTIKLYSSHDEFKKHITAECVTDTEIQAEIKVSLEKWGQVICPHTATAAVALTKMNPPVGERWIMVATAHPAKFETIVEPLVGHPLPVPPALQEILKKPQHFTVIEPSYSALLKGETPYV